LITKTNIELNIPRACKAKPQNSTKGQLVLRLTIDSLGFRSSERAQGEDAYMVGRLRKYRAHLLVTRSGQVLSLEEEPHLPPVDFSPLNFGRLFLYGLAAFPDSNIKIGTRWESQQSLLDKFHPEARLIRHFRLISVRQTPTGPTAEIAVAMQAFLEADLGSESQDSAVSLTGKGSLEFNLQTGRLISSDLKMEGLFYSQQPANASDSTPAESRPMRLQSTLRLRFLD
jgi:hypothetical protein